LRTSLIVQKTVDVKLADLATAVAGVSSDYSPVTTFRFAMSTGDLLADEASYIELANGSRIQITDELIDRAVEASVAKSIAAGFVINDTAVKSWRNNPPLASGSDSFLSVHLEVIPDDVPPASPEALAAALTQYFNDLPDDFNRAVLNHLPRPSIWPAIVHKLLSEEGYPHLVGVIRDIGGSLSEDIAVLMCCEIVKGDAAIMGPSAKRDLDLSKPEQPEQIRVWGEHLLSIYSGQ
jgi:hypothetical protein